MGTLFTDKAADYSAISVGHAGLYTSVTSGLLALFETRRSASKAINNSAPGGAEGSIIGSPTFGATNMQASFGAGETFLTKPSGSHTIALVVVTKNGGSSSDIAVGSFSASAVTTGATYFTMYNQRLTLASTSYATGAAPPLSGNSNINAYIDFTLVQPELVVGVVESGVSARLYHPRTGLVVTTAATGRDFVYDNPTLYQTFPVAGSGATFNESLFAHWNRVLTPAEIATFYSDIRSQYALLGLSI